jgi:hypothetical protein
MKKITFKGTEEQLYNLQDIYEQCNKTKPKEVETRVYALHCGKTAIKKGFDEITQEKWIETCERQGGVYTLEGFQRAFNEEEIDSQYCSIRFIEIEM